MYYIRSINVENIFVFGADLRICFSGVILFLYLQHWKEAHITGVSPGPGVRLKRSSYPPGVSISFFWVLHHRAFKLHLLLFVCI